MRFELFVALRYLRARSSQAVLSVATWVSVAGVAAGVMALHIALALNEGIQQEFLTRILGATSHLNLRSLTSAVLTDYARLSQELSQVEGVDSVVPSVSGYALFESALREQPGILKGVDLENSAEYREISSNIRQGSLEGFGLRVPPAIALGSQLASELRVAVGDRVRAIGTRGGVSPVGRFPGLRYFEVAAIYESGLWDYDANLALISIPSAQDFYGYGAQQASMLEFRLSDFQAAEEVAGRLRAMLGESFEVRTWIEINRPLFSALRVEKLALLIAIGLIVLVASLNIVSTLTLMVKEKGRDIAIITALGGARRTLLAVFMLQGLVIGVVGTSLGSLLGLSAVQVLDRYRLIPLDPQVYQISYLPFRLEGADGWLIVAAAVLISFLATIYPARAAASLDPVVALRNE